MPGRLLAWLLRLQARVPAGFLLDLRLLVCWRGGDVGAHSPSTVGRHWRLESVRLAEKHVVCVARQQGVKHERTLGLANVVPTHCLGPKLFDQLGAVVDFQRLTLSLKRDEINIK